MYIYVALILLKLFKGFYILNINNAIN